MVRSRNSKLAFAALAILALVLAFALLRRTFAPGTAASRTTTYEVGDVVQGEVIEHVFVFTNEGTEDLLISEVTPWASELVSADSVLPAGGEARVAVKLSTANLRGPLNELIKVRFVEDKRVPLWLQLSGRVVPPVHIDPTDRVYFFTVTGDTARQELELVSHEQEPLQLLSLVSDNPLFRVSSEPLEPGRRYRLNVDLEPGATPGHHRGTVEVRTSSEDYASLTIQVWARVKDLVSTSLTRVDFSRFPMESLNLKAVSRRTVVVEKHQGTDFQVVKASTDVPFIDVEVEPQNPGQSFLIHLIIDEKRAEKGEFGGSLVIETNDPAFTRLEIPVRGAIL